MDAPNAPPDANINTARTENPYEKISIKTDAADQLREVSARMSGETGRRITLSETVRRLIKRYSDDTEFTRRFGLGKSHGD